MKHIPTTATSVEHLKARAKTIKSVARISHSAALEQAAQEAGYRNWHHVQWCLARPTAQERVTGVMEPFAIICGVGSGGHYWIKELLLNALMEGGQVFVFEAGGGCRDFSSVMGGSYVTLGDDVPGRHGTTDARRFSSNINVFALQEITSDSARWPATFMAAMKSVLAEARNTRASGRRAMVLVDDGWLCYGDGMFDKVAFVREMYDRCATSGVQIGVRTVRADDARHSPALMVALSRARRWHLLRNAPEDHEALIQLGFAPAADDLRALLRQNHARLAWHAGGPTAYIQGTLFRAGYGYCAHRLNLDARRMLLYGTDPATARVREERRQALRDGIGIAAVNSIEQRFEELA